MNRDGGIAEHGFRPGRGDDQRRRRIVRERIANMPQTAVALFMRHFDIGQGGFAARTPVDQPLGAVEQLVFPKFDERFAHRPRQPFVHGETLMAPVAGNPQRAQLMQDRVTGFLFPLPHPFNKFFTPQCGPARAAQRQLTLDDILRGDAGVIGARHPEHARAVHPLVAAQDILQRVVKGMAHVQRTGHIGRRNNHRKVVRAGFRRLEQPGADPVGIPLVLDLVVAVSFRQLHRNGNFSFSGDHAGLSSTISTSSIKFFPALASALFFFRVVGVGIAGACTGNGGVSPTTAA